MLVMAWWAVTAHFTVARVMLAVHFVSLPGSAPQLMAQLCWTLGVRVAPPVALSKLAQASQASAVTLISSLVAKAGVSPSALALEILVVWAMSPSSKERHR